MIRTKINDLKDYLRGSSSTLGSPDFTILLDVSAPEGSNGDRVFLNLIQLALNEYEKLNPVYLYGRLYDLHAGKVFTMEDNFGSYLEGGIPESQIKLIPISVIHMGDSWVYQYKDFIYTPPYLSIGSTPYNNTYYYMARRPVLITYEEDGSLADESFIYFIDTKASDRDRWFLRYLEYETLIYLRDQKNNLIYPDLPIDYLSSLPERIAEVMQILEGYRITPYKHGEWYV